MYHKWSRTVRPQVCVFYTSLCPRESKKMALSRYMRPKEGLSDLLGVDKPNIFEYSPLASAIECKHARPSCAVLFNSHCISVMSFLRFSHTAKRFSDCYFPYIFVHARTVSFSALSRHMVVVTNFRGIKF